MNRRDFIKISGAAALTAACGRASDNTATEEEGVMSTRVNPLNGDRTSLIGYGCMRWPMIPGPDGAEVIDQNAVNEMVDYAVSHGINYFDTSPAYLQGQSEAAAGEALSRYPRESYYLATKLSNFGDASREASIQMYEDSFKHLRTDYIDYYFLHAIGGGGVAAFEKRYEENGLLDFLIEQKAKGRIRNLGFSFHGNQEAFDHFMVLHDNGRVKWDFVMIEMNYIDWEHADGVRNVNANYLYAELDKRELPVMVMEPLLGGRLASPPAEISAAMKSREPDASAASWAFRFIGTYPRVQVILSGMNKMDHIVENVKTFSPLRPLSEEELEFLAEMAARMQDYPLINCTGCKYCMPCPWGIDIPGIFQYYNKSITEGTFAHSQEQKNYRKIKNAYLTGYNKAIPTLRQADHCIGCGWCMHHCPQSIRIPHELHRIDKYIESLKQDTL